MRLCGCVCHLPGQHEHDRRRRLSWVAIARRHSNLITITQPNSRSFALCVVRNVNGQMRITKRAGGQCNVSHARRRSEASKNLRAHSRVRRFFARLMLQAFFVVVAASPPFFSRARGGRRRSPPLTSGADMQSD